MFALKRPVLKISSALRSLRQMHIKRADLYRSDFDQQLESAGEKLVVVDFFATWCGPCKMIAPKLEELSKEYVDKVVIIKVDVDECEDIAMEYNISSMPTFIFIKNKQKVEEFAGANAEKLTNTIQKLA